MVSIIVCSYNSEKTILETLESLEKQTYKNFEVIITDDSSQDNTLNIIEKWKKTNVLSNRIKLITSEVNEGTVKNINKGIREAKGEWIKIIAADDILLENCLKDNIEWIKNKKDILVLTSRAQYFTKEGDLKRIAPLEKDIKKFEYSSENQYNELLKRFYICSVTSFIKREILIKIGGFDERIPLIEDYPFFLKVTKSGIKIHYMPILTVKYRINESVSNSKKNIINIKFFNSQKLVYKYYLKENISIFLKLHYKYEFLIYDFFINVLKNKKTIISTTFLKLLKCIDPYYIIRRTL